MIGAPGLWFIKIEDFFFSDHVKNFTIFLADTARCC